MGRERVPRSPLVLVAVPVPPVPVPVAPPAPVVVLPPAVTMMPFWHWPAVVVTG